MGVYGFDSLLCYYKLEPLKDYMGTKISTSTSTVNQSFVKPFEFLGNVGTAKVQKFRSYLGDGDNITVMDSWRQHHC